MLKRIGEVIYFVVFAVLMTAIIVIPTYQIGVIGWFIGVGFIMTTAVLMALVESIVKYIVLGDWEFPVTQK